MKERLMKLYRRYREFVVYVIVGCCTTLINLLIYALFNWVLGNELYLISNVIAWIISVTFAFFMNKLVVFRSKGKGFGQALLEAAEFYGARLFSLALESVGLWLFIDVLLFERFGFDFVVHISGETIAKFIMLVVVTISNYIFSKFIIFKKKGDENK